jgi:hypothetical protein
MLLHIQLSWGWGTSFANPGNRRRSKWEPSGCKPGYRFCCASPSGERAYEVAASAWKEVAGYVLASIELDKECGCALNPALK